MVYHNITRADGTVLDSNSIMSFTFLDNVNDSTDLNPGSVCANSIVFTVWTNGAALQMTAGETLVAESTYAGSVIALGKYTTETPKKSSKNIYTITAYDNVSKLDVDVSSAWLKNVTFPISMQDFTESLLDHLGLELGACDLVNGGYMIQSFYSDGMTGRVLLSWVAQANGCFVRADSDGAIAFGWYTQRPDIMISTEESDATVEWVGTDGFLHTNAGEYFIINQESYSHAYKQSSLSFEDFTVPSIDKVQITQTDDDVGVIRPTDAEGTNTLVVQSNLLLTTDTEANLAPVAQNLYEKLAAMTYTPCSVTITAMTSLRAGDIIWVDDINGAGFFTYITSITNSASGALVVSTGNSSRDSVTATNESTYTNLEGRVLNIQTSVDGLNIKAEDLAGQYTELDLDVYGLSLIVDPIGDAVNAAKLTFDAENGLTITNGGFRILNSSNEQVLSADTDGRLVLVGSITGDSMSLVNYSTSKTYLTIDMGSSSLPRPALKLLRTDGSAAATISTQGDSGEDAYINLTTASGISTLFIGSDGTYPYMYLRNGTALDAFSVVNSSSTSTLKFFHSTSYAMSVTANSTSTTMYLSYNAGAQFQVTCDSTGSTLYVSKLYVNGQQVT